MERTLAEEVRLTGLGGRLAMIVLVLVAGLLLLLHKDTAGLEQQTEAAVVAGTGFGAVM